jgi:hypothetical protein
MKQLGMSKKNRVRGLASFLAGRIDLAIFTSLGKFQENGDLSIIYIHDGAQTSSDVTTCKISHNLMGLLTLS